MWSTSQSSEEPTTNMGMETAFTKLYFGIQFEVGSIYLRHIHRDMATVINSEDKSKNRDT